MHIYMYTYVVQGLEKSWETHRKCAEMLWEGAEKLGLELLVQEKVCEGNKIILRSKKNNITIRFVLLDFNFIVYVLTLEKNY